MEVESAQPQSDRATTVRGGNSVTVHGKFFFEGEKKFFVKGVTYGPFKTGSHGDPFPERPTVEKDLSLMAELGANCLRTFTVPPAWLLDMAGEHGVRVLAGIPWAEHICFLKSSSVRQDIRRAISDGVSACKGHPALFAFLLGNEIPPDIVRWHGPERIRGFLKDLMDLTKGIDPGTLVSYANFPSTEYLQVDFTDFVSFNVYLHREDAFRRYVSRLHNLAGEKPLVLTEFGIDSIREGKDAQANILSWQVRACFDMGLAGTTVFSWTDEWFTGGYSMDGWAFGLVDASREKKPSFHAVQRHYSEPLPPSLAEYPRVSVVVCAYNAERTMRMCLDSLQAINYPDYETIVVNDGSADRTLEIARGYEYENVKIIDQPNRGLSAARNAGIAAATGDIVAFTDSDCVADPDWLTYMVSKFLSSGLSAVGGPNFPPPEDSFVPSCVAASPGGPTPVLLSDDVAEHIAGCNMAFRREALEGIGGFDTNFRVAGDDVDLCWRLQNEGYQIGFSPAAVVWHFRRNTVAAYLKQQRGYGKAESLVYFKHPYRFNLLGQTRWLGRIYGDLSSSLFSRRAVIYSGVFGRALFQTLYEPPSSLISFLPLTLEWNLAALLIFLCTLAPGGIPWWLGAAPLLCSLLTAGTGAMKASIDPRHDGPHARLLVAALIYLGPLVRSWERYKWRIAGYTEVEPVKFPRITQKPEISWHERAFFLDYWSEDGLEKESLLQAIMDFLLPRKYFVAIDQGWNDWDLKVSRGIWSRAHIKVCCENHGGNKRRLRIRCSLRFSKPAILSLSSCAVLIAVGASFGMPQLSVLAAAVGCIHTYFITNQKLRLGHILHHVTEIAAGKAGLTPIRPIDENPVR
ncbi:MAG: glycosyltransferase [Syntrophobacteraceae bacterium]